MGSRLLLFHLQRVCQHAIDLRKHQIVQRQHLPAPDVGAHERELDLSQGCIWTSDKDYRDCIGLLQRWVASRAVVTTNRPIFPAVLTPTALHKHSEPPVYAICACRKSVSACPDSVSGHLSDGFHKLCGCPILKLSDRETPHHNLEFLPLHELTSQPSIGSVVSHEPQPAHFRTAGSLSTTLCPPTTRISRSALGFSIPFHHLPPSILDITRGNLRLTSLPGLRSAAAAHTFPALWLLGYWSQTRTSVEGPENKLPCADGESHRSRLSDASFGVLADASCPSGID